MIDIPLPRLLDSNGNTAGYIHPISESINLEITPLSYASMVLPVGQTLPARSFVELFTNVGSVGIFRVRSPQDAYGEETTTAELEHAIVEVGDWLVRANIYGTMPIQTAMTQIFSHYRGTKWQLGNISALGTDTIAVTIEYERVLDAMMKILAMKPECYLDFDFSTSPWTVSVNQRDTTVTAEGRLSRNVNSANVTYDDTDLCTRVYYPVDTIDSTTGATVRTWYSLDADTLTTYGVAERSVYNADDTTAAEALRTAQEYLNLYKKPKFGVQISGEELSSITGESLDRFGIGKLFRLALTDYNTTIDQNITSLSWDDVYNAPTSVMVNLADEEAGTFDMVTALHQIDKNGGTASGGRGSSGYQFKNEMQGGQYKTKIDQTDRYIDLVAQKVNNAGDILQQAGLYLDSDGVLVYADDFENNLGAKLNVQANRIGMVVGTYQGRDYIKAAEIATAINDAGEGIATINAAKVNISATSTLHSLAGAIEEDDNGNVTIVSAGGMRVRKTSGGITSEFGVFDNDNLTAGVIVDKVNGGSVYLKGSKVWVGDAESDQTLKKWATESDGIFARNIGALSARIGTIEADYVTADEIDANYITTRLAQASSVSVALLNTSGAAIFGGGTYATNGLWVEGTRLNIGNGNPVQSVVGASITGGGYKLTVTQANGDSHDITFNTASSITFSGAWTGASYTATAKDPDDNVLGSVTTAISKRWNGSDLLVESGNDTLLTESMSAHVGTGNLTTGGLRTIDTFNSSHKAFGYVIGNSMSYPLFTFNVDASGEYTAGRTAGAASVTVSAAGWQGGSNVVSASNGESVTVSMPAVTMSSGSWSSHKKTVYAYSSAAGITGYIASHEVDATTEYNSGVTAGNTAAGVTSSWSGNTFTVTRAANTTTKSLSCIVTITPNSAKTLGYGESVTVKALGNASEKASVTITAPADRYQTGYNAGWAAARAKISRSGNKIMVPPATVDGAAVTGYEVTVIQGSISASRVTSSLYALSASASAYISGTSVATDSTSRSLTV